MNSKVLASPRFSNLVNRGVRRARMADVRRAAGALVATSLALVAASCGLVDSGGGSGESGSGDGPITLGQTAPQSGESALLGQTTNGLRAYFEKVNDDGGINGRQIKVVSLDDGYDPARTVQALKLLQSKYNALADVGPVGSPTTAAALPAAQASNFPIVAPQTGASSFYEEPIPEMLFLSFPDYFVDGKTLGDFAAEKGFERVGVLYQNDDFGKSILKGIESTDANLVAKLPYDVTQTDFSPQAIELRSADVDAVILVTLVGTTVKFIPAMESINFRPEILLSQSSATTELINTVGEPLQDAYISAFIPPLWDTDNEQVKEFRDAMEKYQPGEDISSYAAWGWLSAQIAVAGLEQSESPLDTDAYVSGMNQIEGLATIGGEVSYAEDDHVGLDQMFMLQIKGDRFVEVEE